ncbi:hypothetical protein DTL42_14205 [Bremerella cremea]|uniref:Uncharacterized protein n=2 Tax=Bremerella cremea TaxID=1031537 RepID=A0A368KPV6_9BACT|nr:hypothetical protein DTL42_14205 [Bremerella cremea]
MSRKEFAQETFAAFEPYINIFDPGQKATWGDGTVYHTITKEDWKNYHLWKGGLNIPGFSAQRDVALNIFRPWHVEQHIFKNWPSYYTGGKNGQAMFYQDTDAHHPWQIDQERARELLEADFPFGYFCRSRRGENSYLKARYNSVVAFNRTADRMQDVIRRWFLHNEILCDFETKGTITTDDKSGSLAKLPFHSSYEERLLLLRRWQPFEEEMLKSYDDWCYYRLEEFRAKETVNVARINRILENIEKRIDESKVHKFAAYKEEIRARHEAEQHDEARTPRRTSVAVSILEKKSPQPALSSLRSEKDGSLGRAINCGSGPDGVVPSVGKTGLSDIRSITDAHQRRLKFSWWISCRLRRVATVEEALAAYKEHGCFSGQWEDGLERRTNNFRSCLEYVANIFDPAKCGSGKPQRPELDEQIRECFGIARFHLIQSGSATVKINVRVWYDEYGQRHESTGRNRVIDRRHAHFLHGIIRHSVAVHEDGAIPLKTMQCWWEKLANEGKLPEWEYDYYLACRTFLENLGWINVSGTWSRRNHKAQTCQITYTKPSVVGTTYRYPEQEEQFVSYSAITLITQSVAEDWPASHVFGQRPLPRGQPPPSRLLPSRIPPKISWN